MKFENSEQLESAIVEEFKEELGLTVTDIRHMQGQSIEHYEVDVEEDNAEYKVFYDTYRDRDDNAKFYAEDMVKDMIENDIELFEPNHLRFYVYMTDTDRRLTAGEEADHIVEDVGDDALVIMFFKDDYDVVDEEEKLKNNIEKIENEEEGEHTNQEERLGRAQDELYRFYDRIREEAQSNEYDRIYDELEDPIEHFVENQGLYTEEDLLKQNFINIDEDKFSKDAVRDDGVAHYIASYDGNEEETTNFLVFRTN